MATAKDCHVLINYYLKAFEGKHGRKPIVNRNTARWGFDNMLQDLSMVEVKELTDFYMKTGGSHNNSLSWFFNNYDRLLEHKQTTEADIAERAQLREETKRLTEEWRKKKIDNDRREVD